LIFLTKFIKDQGSPYLPTFIFKKWWDTFPEQKYSFPLSSSFKIWDHKEGVEKLFKKEIL
jgi:hypothetical protein